MAKAHRMISLDPDVNEWIENEFAPRQFSTHINEYLRYKMGEVHDTQALEVGVSEREQQIAKLTREIQELQSRKREQEAIRDIKERDFIKQIPRMLLAERLDREDIHRRFCEKVRHIDREEFREIMMREGYA